MIIEIKSPTPDLEKDIITFIPVNYRYKKNDSYYIEPSTVTLDPFTDRVVISIEHHYIIIKLIFYIHTQCVDVIAHKGGI